MINILTKQDPQRSDFAALLLFTFYYFCQISASLSITPIAEPYLQQTLHRLQPVLSQRFHSLGTDLLLHNGGTHTFVKCSFSPEQMRRVRAQLCD